MQKKIFLPSGINEKSDLYTIVPFAYLLLHWYAVSEEVKILCSSG